MINITPKAPFVLLEDSRTTARDKGSYLFTDPIDCLEIYELDKILHALETLETWQKEGYYCAGFLSYEAGYTFEAKLRKQTIERSNFPLFWFGAFQTRTTMDSASLESFWRAPTPSLTPYRASQAQASTDFQAYRNGFNKIQEWIKAGDVYQVNLTFPMTFTMEGDVTRFYRHIREAQRVAYSAYIATTDWTILSFSPELFIKRKSGEVTSRPMKGTAPRPGTIQGDETAAAQMARDEKSRAENLMIVDLIRNDMSRIAKRGSVQVPKLFNIESYPTVLQMTSEVTAQSDAPVCSILKAMFPCGSVTGAPKIRAMEIINQCEDTPRRVYTGAIGHIAPDGDFCFSVPIRTISMARDGTSCLNVGSGIVADSGATSEYDECLLKARFLEASKGPFDLFETLYWGPGEGFRHLNLHLARLKNSAQYFGFLYKNTDIITALDNAVQGLRTAKRIRLCLSRLGAISVEVKAAPPPPKQPVRIHLSNHSVASNDPWLHHKTTLRSLYNKAKQADCFDTLLTNENGQVTEGCFSNIFIKKDGQLYTPARTCGLLPGVLRESLLQKGICKEAIVTVGDINQADKFYVGNSLRGLLHAQLK